MAYAGSTSQHEGELLSAGAGSWIASEDQRNTSIKIPVELIQTRQGAEIIAALGVLQTAHMDTELHLEGSQNFVATAATKNLNRWMDTGWVGVANPELMKAFAAELCRRTAKTSFSKMKIT